MKNTHDQAFNEKNKIILLLESVVKEQETELESVRGGGIPINHGEYQ